MIRAASISFLLILIIWAGSCNPNEEGFMTPLISLDVSPDSGNTTQIFSFDLTGSESRSARSTKLFARWDWDGDGIWDMPLMKQAEFKHRYYVPGYWHARVQMVDIDGGSDTAEVVIPVARGHTAPRPVLVIQPLEGHIYTEFLLDASQTHDDEDSLDQLTFRWDFNDDGVWDTVKSDSSRIIHVFPVTGSYRIRMEVEDPTGRKNQITAGLSVSLTDPGLIAFFTYTPDSVTDNAPTRFDASGSKDLNDPDARLSYRWDWNTDQTWDTEWLTDPVCEHTLPSDIFSYVRLQVMSQRGLLNQTMQKIRVYHGNIRPRANFTVSTMGGNVSTQFRFDCYASRDAESGPSKMFYRFDFDGDGQADTDFINELVTYHQFSRPGVYPVRLEVRDPIGDTDTCYKTISISQGDNLTDIYEDKRGYCYQRYGTVRIGDQWWFTKNVCYEFADTTSTYIYGNVYDSIFNTQMLYPVGQLRALCPPGWRVPDKADWDTLFANYSEEELFDALKPGGLSDYSVSFHGRGFIINMSAHVCEYYLKDRYGYYWSSTTQGEKPPKSWVIAFDERRKRILRYWDDNRDRLYAVRCVKDAK